jgi:lambda repressor-like predicted transcriptional regulator
MAHKGTVRSTATRLSHQGETLTLKQWATRLGMSHQALRNRLNAGWSIEEALSTYRRPSGIEAKAAHMQRHYDALINDMDRALRKYHRNVAKTRGVGSKLNESSNDRGLRSPPDRA